MANANLKEIREGLAANISASFGEAWQVSPFLLGQATPPGIEIVPGETEYDKAYGGGSDGWLFTVRAFVGLTTDIGSQEKLDGLISPEGMKTAIESDQTLKGLVGTLRATKCSGYKVYKRDGGAPVLGAEWSVSVYT